MAGWRLRSTAARQSNRGRQVDDEFWHDVAVTFTSQDRQLALFIDGLRYRPETIKPKKDIEGHVVRIGSIATDAAENENHHFVGLISEINFYQRALTSEEIAGLHFPHNRPANCPWHDGNLMKQVANSLMIKRFTIISARSKTGAANDTETLKASASFGSKNTEPADGNSPPFGQDRWAADMFARNKVQT